MAHIKNKLLKKRKALHLIFYNLLQVTLENKYSVAHGVRRVISRLEMLIQ